MVEELKAEAPRRPHESEWGRRVREFQERLAVGCLPRPKEYEEIYTFAVEWRRTRRLPAPVCEICFKTLRDRQVRYCSDECRKIAKGRRYRARDPKRKAEIDRKYWQTCGEK